MIGELGHFDGNLIEALLLHYLPLVVMASGLGGGVGWLVGKSLSTNDRAQRIRSSGGLNRSPLTPLIAFGAAVLPFVDLPVIAAVIILSILILIPAMIMALRVYGLETEGRDETQLRLDRQAELKVSWQDTALVVSGFLLSGLIYRVLVSAARESVIDHLAEVPLAIVLSVLIGVGLGWLLGMLTLRLAAHEAARYARGEYGQMTTLVGGAGQWAIKTLFTQFHATPLTGVLIVLGIALPFTTLPQTTGLFLVMFAPVMSAVLAARLVDDPDPGQPDEWYHWRVGILNVAQVGVAYLLGAALLIPLAEQHAWMLSDSDEVIKQLNTHLELTVYALGISIALGVLGGILTSRVEALRTILINLGNIGRTIPSLAVLALALPIFGVGRDPSLVALVFIGTLPILVNTSVGIIEVTNDIKESARGMGMNDMQVLLRVEVPIAMPVIMAGVRTSAVLVVASATLAGFIGGGGLGALIIRGDGSGRNDILITGAVLATILAIFLEYFFGWLETLLTPRGLRET